MGDKAFWKSKTWWLNVIGVTLTILSTSDITPLLPAKATPYLAATVAILNVILRSLKSEGQGGLALTDSPAPPVPPK